MSDKHEPAKHAAPHKHDPEKTEHEAAVAEGVKAAESHQPATEEVAKERKPVKVAPPHPLVVEMTKLKDEVAEVSKKHREELLDLRDKLQELMFKCPPDMPGQSAGSFLAVATQIEEGLNMLDPDCSAKAPG